MCCFTPVLFGNWDCKLRQTLRDQTLQSLLQNDDCSIGEEAAAKLQMLCANLSSSYMVKYDAFMQENLPKVGLHLPGFLVI